MSARWPLVVGACALGFVVSRWMQPDAAAPPPAPHAPVARAGVIEVRAEARTPAAPPVAAPTALAPIEATPEQQLAGDRAAAIVSRGIAARRWTDDDARDLHAALVTLTADQIDHTIRSLIVAVNRDELAVDGRLF